MTEKPFFDDAHLIGLVQKGTNAEARAAFGQLVVRHHSHLLVHLRCKGLTSHELKEVASETWFRAFRKISGFEYRGIDLFPWLRKIADWVIKEHNRAIYRSQRLEEPLEDADGEEKSFQDPGPSLYQQLSREEMRRAIEEILPDAPSDYRELITAKLIIGLEQKEIGELYGWSMAKVYTVTHRAFAWIRQKLLERHGLDAIKDWLS
ncbi:MAG: RNA polymerase sigma factor [Candidatus Omnitrophica bacterium]|nr:RNA polymerase sigma factor [Candidatus Omnitrophota bacterium]